ncbi:hypothetical protein RJ640_025917 [Escallonia rubra]|uniref:DUF3741 domain-containing protein n=1 Tax=Escallonia rubra TaxID=112253 RepID=A0AA88U8I4_9ASTE|nr:hypothetical protein RJ640_025917 [Escallonia rubra]
MKFLSSSASSAASSSSTTTTTTTCDGGSKSANSGCLIGVLRRLLCFNNLPTYPSDHIKETEFEVNESESLHCVKTEDKFGSSGTPGIVARLMGLDSMPGIGLEKTQISPNSVARSRSMNSADSLKELESMQGEHRRVKSSLSFREAPTFLEQENEEFFILSFEELGSRNRKYEIDFGELKQRRAERSKKKNKTRERVYEENKENLEANCTTSQSDKSSGRAKDSSIILPPVQNSHLSLEVLERFKPIYHEENAKKERRRKRRRRKKKESCSGATKVEADGDTENSSPVSVLDFVPEALTSDSRLTSSKSRKKLAEKLESYMHLSTSDTNSNSLTVDDCELKRIESKNVVSRSRAYRGENYVDMWGEICNLAETETRQSNWMYREVWKLEDFQEVGSAFGWDIAYHRLNPRQIRLMSSGRHRCSRCCKAAATAP